MRNISRRVRVAASALLIGTLVKCSTPNFRNTEYCKDPLFEQICEEPRKALEGWKNWKDPWYDNYLEAADASRYGRLLQDERPKYRWEAGRVLAREYLRKGEKDKVLKLLGAKDQTVRIGAIKGLEDGAIHPGLNVSDFALAFSTLIFDEDGKVASAALNAVYTMSKMNVNFSSGIRVIGGQIRTENAEVAVTALTMIVRNTSVERRFDFSFVVPNLLRLPDNKTIESMTPNESVHVYEKAVYLIAEAVNAWPGSALKQISNAMRDKRKAVRWIAVSVLRELVNSVPHEFNPALIAPLVKAGSIDKDERLRELSLQGYARLIERSVDAFYTPESYVPNRTFINLLLSEAKKALENGEVDRSTMLEGKVRELEKENARRWRKAVVGILADALSVPGMETIALVKTGGVLNWRSIDISPVVPKLKKLALSRDKKIAELAKVVLDAAEKVVNSDKRP